MVEKMSALIFYKIKKKKEKHEDNPDRYDSEHCHRCQDWRHALCNTTKVQITLLNGF